MNNRNNESLDRLFFHDLINQTHGVTLFLNYKVGISGNMNTEEIKDILQEIKVLQSLIKDHFHFSHKNLHNISEIVSFHRIKHELMVVINNFLPEHVSHKNITFKNNLNDERFPCLVNSPVLFRVVTNLVKNISEEHSRYVEIEFSYDIFGLNFQIKNKILNLNDDYKNVLTNLQKIILINDNSFESFSKQDSENGLGLKSIFYLCEKEGGKCNFRLEGDYWITEVFLPDPIQKFQKNSLKVSA
ncbi:MAG: GHKL domain-containing protein [Bacteriovoracaceae bacterium]